MKHNFFILFFVLFWVASEAQPNTIQYIGEIYDTTIYFNWIAEVNEEGVVFVVEKSEDDTSFIPIHVVTAFKTNFPLWYSAPPIRCNSDCARYRIRTINVLSGDHYLYASVDLEYHLYTKFHANKQYLTNEHQTSKTTF